MISLIQVPDGESCSLMCVGVWEGQRKTSDMWMWNWGRLIGTMRALVTQTGVSPRTICGCVCWDISPGPSRMQISVNNIISFSLWQKIHLYLCPTCFPHPWWGFWTPRLFFFFFFLLQFIAEMAAVSNDAQGSLQDTKLGSLIYCRYGCSQHWCTRTSPICWVL